MSRLDKHTEQLLLNYHNANSHLYPLKCLKFNDDLENPDLRHCIQLGKPGISMRIIMQIFAIGYHKGQDDAMEEQEGE